jgi:methylenetetrahydrofolate dehydrogenase (NADP+)/methenyltetrahydrofolate cyclohydrolase
MKLLDGKALANDILDKLALKVKQLDEAPHLVVIQVGNDPASSVYVLNKERTAKRVGIKSETIKLSKHITQDELLEIIDKYNNDASVNGILVQLPLPEHIDEQVILEAISPVKDVDGFHPLNVGKLNIGQKQMIPSTPAGIMELLKANHIEIEGKHVVIVGRSNIVGKPLAHLLLEENATVTVAHSRTKNLKQLTKLADILVVAVGQPELITDDYVKAGAVVIDVGINRTDTGLKGDVDFNSVKSKVAAITPVPGGVGPMTIAMLMNQTYQAYRTQNDI